MNNLSSPPNLLFFNGVIRSGVPQDPTAEALAIRGSRIVCLGANSDIKALAGPKTRLIDLHGALVLPGFNDAHVHFLAGGFSLSRVDLRNAADPAAFASGLAEWAQRIPDGQWVLGGDWDHEKWPGTPLPSRQLIDPLTGDRPVFVSRFDGHMALANSRALALAGISRDSIDPPGGVIVRDPLSGEPTGILKDCAQDLVTRVIPNPSRAQKLSAARAATDHAASLGVTSVTDVSADDDVALYREMAAQEQLKTRIYAARPVTSWESLAAVARGISPAADMVRIGAIKGFADGSLGSSTALFFEPYADDPRNCGLLFDQMLPEGIMLERALAADTLGFQILIHAIGDAANRQILDLHAALLQKNGPRDRRFRIEHAQHLHPSDIPRFASQGVIASVQPYHAADDGCWCEKRLGPGRCKFAYPFKSLLNAGAILAFGSDWTVAPLNPLPALKAAVTRQTLDGRNPEGWEPAEKLSLDEAVRAFTFGSAFAEFAESEKGVLSPGKLADLVVLDRDIFALPPEAIPSARVLMTIVDGKIVFES
jgi:predicted amidohydrolase YtcJ